MSDSVKIVQSPYSEGQTKKEVRSALVEAYPGFRVASILRDDERWLARLVASAERVHHKLADDDESSDAPFPLKELGPDGDSDSDSKDDESSDDDSDSDTNTDDDELKDDEKPAEDDKEDVKGELTDLVKQFKKLLPALEKVIGPIDEDEGPGDLDKLPDDIGPTPGNEGPMPGGPPGAPPGGPMGGPPGAPPGPPRRPAAPPGAGRRPGGPPRPGVPTFTSAKPLRLTRAANVTAEEAKQELAAAYPDMEIISFTEGQNGFEVTLKNKETT